MKWEFRLLDAIRKRHSRFWDRIMTFFTSICNAGLIWHVISLSLILWESTRFAGFCTFFSAIIASGFANLVVKPLVSRDRPCDRRPELPAKVKKKPHGSSFPSGHAATSVGGAVGGAIGLLWTMGGTPAIIFGAATGVLALLISYSRMYLYVHFPTDVLVGIALGVGFGIGVPYGVHYLYQFLLTVA